MLDVGDGLSRPLPADDVRELLSGPDVHLLIQEHRGELIELPQEVVDQLDRRPARHRVARMLGYDPDEVD